MSDRRISDRVLAELRLVHAQHALRAERARAEQRTGNALSGKTVQAGKVARHHQEIADDYAWLLAVATGEES